MATNKKTGSGSSKKAEPDTLEIFDRVFKQELEKIDSKGGRAKPPAAGGKASATQGAPTPSKQPPKPIKKIGKKPQETPPGGAPQTKISPAQNAKPGMVQAAPGKAPARSLPKRPAPASGKGATRATPGQVTTARMDARSSTGAITGSVASQRKKTPYPQAGLTGEVKTKIGGKDGPLPLPKASRGETYISNTTQGGKKSGFLRIALLLVVLLLLAGWALRQYNFFGRQELEDTSVTVRKKIAATPLPGAKATGTKITPAESPKVVSSGTGKGPVAIPRAAEPADSPSPLPSSIEAETAKTSGQKARQPAKVVPTQPPGPPGETGAEPGPQRKKAGPKPGIPVASIPGKATGHVRAGSDQPSTRGTPLAAAWTWTPSYPFSVYLGSFKNTSRVEKATSKYRDRGIGTYWTRVDLGEKGIWYRLFTGSFRTKKEAQAFIKKHHLREGASRRTRYAILMGLDKSPNGLEARMRSLVKTGYTPYILKDSKGHYGLFLGAFYRKERANKTSASLAKMGFSSKVVLR
ncbi:MAG: SPOR domain-containing protein [Deltaproteobacteria bacterium]|nr:SPOR domain-containing protein [Deltaproteobacteria bacterium]